jgi:sarcosine oxidase
LAGQPVKTLRRVHQRLVALEIEGGDAIEAEQFVLCPGPWTPRVLPELAPYLRITRQVVLYYEIPPADAVDFAPERFPVFLDLENGFYGIPAHGEHGFKLAHHVPGEPIDPDQPRSIDEGTRARYRAYLALRFPRLAKARETAGEVCCYSMTPDEHFIIDRHPELENVWVACGFSGHGFKFGPYLGERLAQRVMGIGEAWEAWPTFALRRPGLRPWA